MVPPLTCRNHDGAPAIAIFVKHAGVALLQIGDDEARVGALRARLDARDDPLDPAPARGPVVKLLETARLYRQLARELGEPVYDRVEAPATPEQKELLSRLSPQQLRLPDPAWGEQEGAA